MEQPTSKKQSVMGRLKSKLTNTLKTTSASSSAKKGCAAPNDVDIASPPDHQGFSDFGECNQGTTPRADSSLDIEHYDDDDHAVGHGEPRDDETPGTSDLDASNNEGPTDEEVMSSVADLVVIGNAKSPLKVNSPAKRMFPPGPSFHHRGIEDVPSSTFAPDSLIAPPETRRSTDNLCPSPLKRTSVHPSDRLAPLTNQHDKPPPRKARAPSFNENAPILASASAAVDATDTDDAASSAPEVSLLHDAKDAAIEDFDAGAAITSVFGERVARLLGADPWGDRQDGFDAISLFVKKFDPTSSTHPAVILTAALAAINCGAVDRVAPVMYCSLECLQHVLAVFAPLTAKSPKRFLAHAPLTRQLLSLQTSLLAKLNDSNKRTQREATTGLLRLAKAPRLQVLPSLLATFDADPLDKARLELIHDLVAELGYSAVDGGVPVDRLLAWSVPALKIADEKTRKLALDIAAHAILHAADPPAALESITGIKPAMLKVLQRRVDEVKAGGVPASANQTDSSVAGGENGAPTTTDDPADAHVEIWDVPKEDDASVTTLLAAAMREAETLAGPVVWRKLESKTWSDRKEALVDVEKAVEEHKSELRDVKPALGSATQTQYVAYNALVHASLSDAIAPVVNQAIEFYSTLIKIYGPHVDWRDAPVKDMTMQSIMRLLAGMQKPNNKTSKGSCRCILKLARMNNHTMQCVVACVFAKDAEPLVQMHVLRLLVPEFGLTSDPATDVPGLNLNSTLVLNAVAAALAHSNDKVRRGAMDVALCTQRLIGKTRVLKRLKDVKPATLKELEKNFVEVEPPTTERPATVQPPPGLGAGLLGEVTASRRLLSSAPVAGGKPDDDGGAMEWTPRGNSILSKDEESLMDSILDG
ncbi:Aste57867_11822 [Aphanomyces stellatus]|uniref:Aste57867_11822 protein n=1 Tax=Aphanomyces stellatus TaxID=120398 RepID=A0A485KUF4_9STRA|nr:hypothetical protein As57867_011777 [Aphanomyces stellatus]VFT88677.1 Aste57867_11822 [Aphanomyces stellatus]